MPSCGYFLVLLLSTLFICPQQQQIGMLPSAAFQEANGSFLFMDSSRLAQEGHRAASALDLRSQTLHTR